MDLLERKMHLAAGEAYGREATCGPPEKPKVDYKSEDSAAQAAVKLSGKYNRDLEGYPCFWCGGWHVGRALTMKERAQWMTIVSAVSRRPEPG